MPLIDRLRLAKDLALQGIAGLTPATSDADAIRGLVLVDLAFDVAARAALDETGRSPASDRFPDLLIALHEIGPHAQATRDLHQIRNRAQHGGIAPPATTRDQLRRDGEDALRIAFSVAGQDFDRFSSVPQITSDYLRPPLERALQVASTQPDQAIALVGRAFERVRGWAEQIVGMATIPNEMWVNASARWSDTRLMVSCADNRDEFIDALLRTVSAAAVKMSVPDWIRLRDLAHGHDAKLDENDEWRFEHAAEASAVDTDEASWAIERVARATLELERDWPEYVLMLERDEDGTPLRRSLFGDDDSQADDAS